MFYFFLGDSIPLFNQLYDLEFPCPRLDDQTKTLLLQVPHLNNKSPLVETRARSSSVRLNIVRIKEFSQWLVVGDEGGLCKACKLFLPYHLIPRTHGKFLSKSWKTFSRYKDLVDHATTDYHKEAMAAMGAFRSKVSGERPPIIHNLDTQLRKDVELRKRRLRSIITALVFCARSGVALRGHRNEALGLPEQPSIVDETYVIKGTPNQGNFIATLSLMRDAGDQNIDIHINKKSSYTSHSIQNELLTRISAHITSQVVSDVKSSRYYSVIADETRDVSNTEVLCVAVRYFDSTTKRPNEHFLRFIPLESLKGMFF